MGRHSQTRRDRSLVRWFLIEVRDATIACLVGMFLIAVCPGLMGWKTTVVVSGSMMPGIRPGDVVSAAPTAKKVELGTIVLVHNPARPDELLMHRVIRFDDSGAMITKGDANASEDTTPVPRANMVGVPRLRVPYIGLPYLWITQRNLTPVIATAIMVIALLLWRPPPRHKDHKKDQKPFPVRPSSRPAGAHRTPIRTGAALLRDSKPAALQPNWTPEAAVAVSTGER
ncbi:signal peptidase I [Actinoplanes sp. NPDC051851]|uniref:signal peptidase I n=1 Tax=Actinoplanes sp. NPDC051851 TaxID=3154753 RepID=UPI00343EFB4E